MSELPPVIFAATNAGKSMFASSREKIEQHLIKQKARAVERVPTEHPALGAQASRCQYRTSEGQMCAAGCVIPDEKYDPKMEGLTAFQVAYAFPDAFPTDITQRELELWQAYHDQTAMQGGETFNYGLWLAGNEAHHPTKFKEAVADWIPIAAG